MIELATILLAKDDGGGIEIISLLVFAAIAMILFYYDIRLRKEGFDLRMMAENL